VFVQTNAPGGANAVQVMISTSGGALRSAGTFRTGRSGTGRQIKSEGTMAATKNGRYLVVLDSGSSTVTVFRVGGGRLKRTDRIASGGQRPVSVATSGNRLLVLNAGGASTIAGFDVDQRSGQIVAVPGLSGQLAQSGARPYSVAISPSGGRVAVSYERGSTGRDVEMFTLSGDRLTSNGVVAVSGGHPGALSFIADDRLLVGRMGQGGPGLATYAIAQGIGPLAPINTAASFSCWIENNGAGTRGWATFPSSVATFPLSSGGAIGTVLFARLPGRTSDLTLGATGRRLYVLNQRNGRVRVLALNARTLKLLGTSPRMPATSTGIVDLPNNIGGFSN
jgi:6-phosphogluconolactonase